MNEKDKSLFAVVLKRKILFLLLIVVAVVAIPYFCYSPISKIISNTKAQSQLTAEVKNKQSELQRIKEENERKMNAARKATVKEFFKLKGNDDVRIAYAPLFENVITMIKQNGIRMKSIRYINSLSDDSLIKNGDGAYNGCQVDFVLVGYYKQFADFLNELDTYPYFISVSKFKITPYQYDKRILIGDVSIVFYSKRY